MSHGEVRQLQTNLHNTSKMYLAQRETNTGLKEKVKLLEAKIVFLETENAELKSKLTDFEFQLNQMKTIVFGKKRILNKDGDDEPKAPVQRTAQSYQRPIPKDEEVTEIKIYKLRESLYPQRNKTFYVEDIPLDLKKIVTKYIVTQENINGVWTGKIPVPTQRLVLEIM